MDAAITVQSVEEAVTIFYRSDAERQKIAHNWLIKAQLGPQAWSFVWELMQLNKVSLVRCPSKINANIHTKSVFFVVMLFLISQLMYNSSVLQHYTQNYQGIGMRYQRKIVRSFVKNYFNPLYCIRQGQK